MKDERITPPSRRKGPDAAIFRLAGAWFAAHRALEEVTSSDGARYEQLSSQYAKALHDLLNTIPATAAGLEAKSAVLAAQIRFIGTDGARHISVSADLEPDPPVGPDLLGHIDLHNLLWYLRRDIAALAQEERRRTNRAANDRGRSAD